jgi:hypothetical protein
LSDTLQFKIERLGSASDDVAVILIDGAFSKASERFKRYITLFERIGCVYVADFDLKNFHTETFLAQVHRKVTTGTRHKRYLIVGLSLGGKLGLQLMDYDYDHGKKLQNIGGEPNTTSIIAAASPLQADHLPFPAKLLTNPKFVTFMSDPRRADLLQRLLFNPMEASKLSKGVDWDEVNEYVMSMRQFRVSAMAAHVVAIQTPARFRGIEAMPTVTMSCIGNTDKVVKGARTREAWRTLGVDLKADLPIKGEHVALVEHYPEWREGLIEAVGLLKFEFRLAA